MSAPLQPNDKLNGRLLIIAGSDSGGGAGIQADIKTCAALGGYAMTAVTAITVQNTKAVYGVTAITPAMIAEQMNVVLDDLGADAIKSGMLFDEDAILAISAVIEAKAKHLPFVLDPVMVAKSGDALLKNSALTALQKKLMPLAALITPNIPEAELLLGQRIHTISDMRLAAKNLSQTGAHSVLLKGGHMHGDTLFDILWDGEKLHEWQSERIISTHTHGTGCTLASAIATYLAQGLSEHESVEQARLYVQGAIKHAPGFGHGHGPLNHNWMTGLRA
jgi:hydroxymethylpyrimidine/phosphomethylpyrimidine kinase